MCVCDCVCMCVCVQVLTEVRLLKARIMDGYKSSHAVAWIQTSVFIIEQQVFLKAVPSLQPQVK